MIALTTKTKIRIAGFLSKTAISLRKSYGAHSKAIFQRGRLRWNLDLNEGIDLSIYLFGQFEPEVAAAYRRLIKPGAVVLDIGANVGAHSLPMAQLCGPDGSIHAFEPTVFAIEKLKFNKSLNPQLASQLFIHHALLNDGRSVAPPCAIPSSWALGGNVPEHRHPQHGGAFKETGEVRQFSVDQFVSEYRITQIDLIKLDVDGNELSVLRGAQHTLMRFAPPILMEFALDYETTAFAEILAIFRELNYEAVALKTRRTLPLDMDSLRNFIPRNGSINVILTRKALSNE